VAESSGVRDYRMLIGGELCASHSGEVLDAVNPATGELFARFPKGDERDIEEAVEAGLRAFPQWWATPPLERAARLECLADLITDHAEELTALDVIDNGSTVRQMRHDASTAAKQLRYFAGLVLEQRGDTFPVGHNRLNFSLRLPFGVVGRIIPFNHPMMFAAQKIGAPLVAGNAVVLKPSEHTSISALRLGELAQDVFPPGVLNIVTGLGSEAGAALVRHEKVRRIAFTGSAEIGRTIQAQAATHVVKTVTLELGGKNPLVVFPDADLDKAMDAAIRGMSFTFQGQSCGSTSRLLVHQSVHEEFVSRLAEKIDALRLGPPDDDSTDVGSIVNRGQYEKVVSYLEIAANEGLKLRAGGGPPLDPSLDNGMFIRPTLYGDVPAGSRLLREEIFGPILVAVPFADYDDAVRIANDVAYGLTASVFTASLSTALQFARDVEAGYVWVNDVGAHILGAPFGGVKDSGVGREENLAEILSYSQEKNVHVLFE
jgi:acyl-CoA reductase-like NAD-dependent aldehyde dehydrogenase